MKVAIVGVADMAELLPRKLRFVTRLRCEDREPAARQQPRSSRNSKGRIAEASDDDIAAADLVIVAVPWSAVDSVIDLLRSTGAERVVSVVVPWTGDDAKPSIGRDDSVAEWFARPLPARASPAH